MPAPFAAALDDDLGRAAGAGRRARGGARGQQRARRGRQRRLGQAPRRGPGHARRPRAWTRWPSRGPRAAASEGLRAVVDALMTVALDQRQAARERKDYDGRRRDQGRADRRRHRDRGHPARPALGAQPVTGRGSPRRGPGGHIEARQAAPGHRRQQPAEPGRQGPDPARAAAARSPGAAPGRAGRQGRSPRRRRRRAGAAGRRRAPRLGRRPPGLAGRAPRPRSSPGATPCSKSCAPRCRCSPCTSGRGWTRTSGSARPSRSPRTAVSRWSRPAGQELDRFTGGAIHQGLALRVRPYSYAHPEDLPARPLRTASSR